MPSSDFIDIDLEPTPEPLAAPARRLRAAAPEPAEVVPFEAPGAWEAARPITPRHESAKAAHAVTRGLPYSAEAEEQLLGACLLDGADVIRRAKSAGVVPQSFYVPANARIFETLCDLFQHNAEVIDVSVVAEELKTKKLLESVGGYPFLTQVSAKVPTTAQAGYYIEKVRELALLREMIRTHAGIVERCYTFTGGIDEFVNEVQSDAKRVLDSAELHAPVVARGVFEHVVPPAKDASVLLGANRYLCRGGACITVAPSGMGKTSMSLQEPICYALGRPFMGIQPNGQLSTLIIQAEDDEGDVGEVVRSVAVAMSLTKEEKAKVNDRVRVIRDNAHTGMEFLSRLAEYVRRVPSDIVVLNPLTSFFDGDLSQQKDLMPFLKGLNRINPLDQWGYILWHHTTKPQKPVNGKNAQATATSWTDAMYNMAGSAVLVNWARAIRTLEPQKVRGEFLMRLAKRGTRAGVVAEVENENGIVHHEITTEIYVKHSSKKAKIDGAEVPLIYWEPSDKAAGQPPEEEGEQGSGTVSRATKSTKPKLYTDSEYVKLFPLGWKNRKAIGEVRRLALTALGMKERAFYEYRAEALSRGQIMQDDRDQRYYRPSMDDAKAQAEAQDDMPEMTE